MKIWDILKLGLVLMIYAVAACTGLAFVYAGTAKTIEARNAAGLEAALKELFPEADGFEDITGAIKSPGGEVSFETEWAVRRDGKLAGVAIRSSVGSYGGPVKILAGVGVDGKISRIKVMEHTDTPGLGANAADPGYYVNEEKKITFAGQFDEKPVSDPFEPKNDVIAITAATITSRAVAVAVKTSGVAAQQWLTEQGVEK
ncbi:MAG: FMN-binding protein [Treponema sp.]|jgi:electron transport complex protein RnfG|nr:FMN-binding protein [Treponema sp.]